jgi:ribosomal RNA-processing protein 9
MLGHQNAISAVAAEPDGTQVYTASMDQSLRIWDLRTQRNTDTLLGHVSGVTALDIYSKGRPLSGGVDKTVRLWKVERDTHLMFNKHSYAVDSVCVVDQDRFVSGSQDGSVMLWSQTSKKPLASTSLGSRQWVSALGAVRRGDIVFSGSSAGKLQGWRLAKAEGGTDKKGFEFVPALDSIQLPGCINQIVVGKRIVACAVGKELKAGRWIYERSMRNGVVIMPLSYSEG